VAGFRLYINTSGGRYEWDKHKFKLPLAGEIIFKSTLSRFARSMALSFKSGMPILQGLSVVGMVVDNTFIRSRIEQMREGIERAREHLAHRSRHRCIQSGGIADDRRR